MSEIELKKLKEKLDNPNPNTHKKVSLFVALFFFAFIILADVFLLFHHSEVFSENENRMLQQAPSLSASKLISGKFMQQFEDFVSDQFFARDSWIQTKLKLDKTLGRKESNGVYLGKQGYLFENPAVPDEQKLERTLDALNRFSASSDLNIVMSVVPNATTVYPELLPSGAPVRDQLSDIGKIEAGLNEKIHFVPLFDALSGHKEEQLYYKGDHHWTSLGAGYAFREIAPALGIAASESNYQILTVADDFSGTMASASGSFETADTVEIYVADDTGEYYVEYAGDPAKYPTIYKSEALKNKDKYEVFFGGNYPEVKITSLNKTGKNLLLLKDSYANCFVQFLLPYFDKIVIIDPRYFSDDLDYEISSNYITDVLILYNENTFVEDNSLAGVLSEEE